MGTYSSGILSLAAGMSCLRWESGAHCFRPSHSRTCTLANQERANFLTGRARSRAGVYRLFLVAMLFANFKPHVVMYEAIAGWALPYAPVPVSLVEQPPDPHHESGVTTESHQHSLHSVRLLFLPRASRSSLVLASHTFLSYSSAPVRPLVCAAGLTARLSGCRWNRWGVRQIQLWTLRTTAPF
jgi:hypothetical protein